MTKRKNASTKRKYAPKAERTPSPSDELEALIAAPMTEAEHERAMAMTDEELADIEAMLAPRETISIGELLLLNVETRIGRIADALETANEIKAAGRNDIAGLTAGVNRLAEAFEAMAGFIGCITESVEGQDGVSRCYVRTQSTTNGILSFQDNRESD